MSAGSLLWRRAPLYVHAHDLCVWLAGRESGATYRRDAQRLTDLADALLGRIATALTFPRQRAPSLDAADRCVLRIRVRVRVLRDAGRMPPRAADHVLQRLEAIGRMLGGWQKSLPAAPTAAARAPPAPH